MTWIVYCHTHIESDRRYIGMTAQSMARRWSQHASKAARSKGGRHHFPNAIRKYGKDAFSHEVLETCETLDEANKDEQRWIKHFDSTDPEKGFNLSPGGRHMPHPFKNPWDRPEYREKRSAISREFWRDPTFRAKVAATRALTEQTKASTEKRSETSKRLWEDPGFRERTSSSIKTRWQDPDYRARVIAASKRARGIPL